MREILFRGKLIATEEWAYGCLEIAPDKSVAIIIPDDTLLGKYGRVDPATVGQYIGLKDKNGVKIYEGDIIRGQGSKARLDNFVIRWSDPCCGFTAGEGKRVWPGLNQATVSDYEVIGNIYENNDLLRMEADNG